MGQIFLGKIFFAAIVNYFAGKGRKEELINSFAPAHFIHYI